MKKICILSILELLIGFLYYYLILPPINVQSLEFWAFITFMILMFIVLYSVMFVRNDVVKVTNNNLEIIKFPKPIKYCLMTILAIFLVIGLIDLVNSPLFNAKAYSKRITIDETGDFAKDIPIVDFSSIPLIDKDSSSKLGDRVMGQMSEFVSQYYVSSQYTQINYNNDIVRVTPLEYAGLIKWISNRKGGVKGYIIVNSVTGKSELKKLDKGMKYLPSAFFNEKLERQLRFKYPTKIFGNYKFEIDNDGNPYFVVPTYSYTGINLRTKVNGVILFNPIDASSKYYDINDVPSWVDNAYNPDLIIEQIDNWGEYKGGFFNSIFGQKNVTNTTEGYNYLAMNDDIYLYTGITSVLADESNLGFVLTNMRTSETIFYSQPGAEEYSAMSSAEGQVQQMKYKSTFPLLINLNNKPTYLVSLKDAAGLVKMYGFVDVADYQKVTVTDASKGILNAANNYLKENAKPGESSINKKTIVVDKVKEASIDGNTYFYIVSGNQKYRASIKLSNDLPFINVGDKLTVGYNVSEDIIEITEIYKD